MRKLTNVQAIKEFFSSPGTNPQTTYPEISFDELKALSREERSEIGALCAEALGDVEIEVPK